MQHSYYYYYIIRPLLLLHIGTLCFDGEVYGFGANAAEEVFWGTVEV